MASFLSFEIPSRDFGGSGPMEEQVCRNGAFALRAVHELSHKSAVVIQKEEGVGRTRERKRERGEILPGYILCMQIVYYIFPD